MLDYIEQMKNLNVLVIGEVIIDEYQYGHTLGKSGKSPVISFQNEYDESYEGGVLAIRNHLRDFCKSVKVLTWENEIHKKRFIQDNQKLFETYSYEKCACKLKSNKITDCDICIIADFGHGFINKKLIHEIESKVNYIALNTQNNSGNMGMNTINKYNTYDYVCLDELELRLACSNQYDNLENIIHNKFDNCAVTVSITKNKEGSYVYKHNNIIKSPALAKEIVDTVGAGDAYFALSSLMAYLDAPAEMIGEVGNLAGAIACSYQGNKRHVTKKELLDFYGN